MNYRGVFRFLGFFLLMLAAAMLAPLFVNFIYSENCGRVFLFSILLTVAAGGLLYFASVFFQQSGRREMGMKEGFVCCTLGWILAAFLGGLPFLISGTVSGPTDSFFEAMSGFTTTGASIFSEVESLPRSILFWRAMTQWLGGIGIIVLAVALLPFVSTGEIQMLQAELPGLSLDKLAPRIKETARLLWAIYLVLTFFGIIALYLAGMGLFDSVCHTFTALATGGFSTKNTSITYFNSPAIEWVTIFLMTVAGLNFTLIYFLAIGRFQRFFQNSEMKFYFQLIVFFTCLVAFNLIFEPGISRENSFMTTFRQALFQVVSIMTTTGFCSTDFNQWPSFSLFCLLILMFIGGCTGSTAGAFKVARLQILFRESYREIVKQIHPRAVLPLKQDGRRLEDGMIQSVNVFLILYLFSFAAGCFVLTFYGCDLVTAISGTAACLGCVGPGFGAVGPMSSYASIAPAGKWVLSILMLLGRLEILTVIVLFTRDCWRS